MEISLPIELEFISSSNIKDTTEIYAPNRHCHNVQRFINYKDESPSPAYRDGENIYAFTAPSFTPPPYDSVSADKKKVGDIYCKDGMGICRITNTTHTQPLKQPEKYPLYTNKTPSTWTSGGGHRYLRVHTNAKPNGSGIAFSFVLVETHTRWFGGTKKINVIHSLMRNGSGWKYQISYPTPLLTWGTPQYNQKVVTANPYRWSQVISVTMTTGVELFMNYTSRKITLRVIVNGVVKKTISGSIGDDLKGKFGWTWGHDWGGWKMDKAMSDTTASYRKRGKRKYFGIVGPRRYTTVITSRTIRRAIRISHKSQTTAVETRKGVSLVSSLDRSVVETKPEVTSDTRWFGKSFVIRGNSLYMYTGTGTREIVNVHTIEEEPFIKN